MPAEIPKEIPKPGQSDQLILPSEAHRNYPDVYIQLRPFNLFGQFKKFTCGKYRKG